MIRSTLTCNFITHYYIDVLFVRVEDFSVPLNGVYEAQVVIVVHSDITSHDLCNSIDRDL